jgi:hypothetical protein
MQLVGRADALLRVEMEPALLVDIPCDRQSLEAAVGQLDQVLLQRVDAEGIAHFIVVQLAVRPVGADEELPIALAERRSDAGVAEA